ncbi:MAG: Hsp20/alpha crystallin family protein [Treponema sp.]|jgi:HSP20 family protein|nr:Hsp20/alpha crystallin family protein [Treponema sp.]
MKTITMYRPNTVQGLFDRPGLMSNFDRYVESFLGDSVLSPAVRTYNILPAVDIRETEKAYMLDMELPGYSEKDIKIHIDGSSLSIAAKQENTDEKKEANKVSATDQDSAGNQNSAESRETWLLRERRINSFSRSFKLPDNANPEEVTAVFKNGILSMEIKKRMEAQKRAIQINAG